MLGVKRYTLRRCEVKEVEGYMSVTTVTDTMYVLRKYTSRNETENAIKTLFLFVGIICVTKSDILTAFGYGWKDFEDSLQAACAVRNKLDYIVTRNVKDFETSVVSVITPDDMLNLLRRQKFQS
ncbi:MAG: PIN domain-containing protein [Syntrophomonadaceae bacterium]|nr:PIN domain-containing protein [Syntrophomonadaceae bacterium]